MRDSFVEAQEFDALLHSSVLTIESIVRRIVTAMQGLEAGKPHDCRIPVSWQV